MLVVVPPSRRSAWIRGDPVRLIAEEEPNPSGTVSARPDGAAGLVERLRSVGKRYIPRSRASDPIELDLIATLTEVAEALSSAMRVEEVLDIIVDRAKAITDTDKAVLVLTDQHDDSLDLDTLVVRGSRSQHLQDWWEPHLEHLGREVFKTGTPLVEVHDESDAVVVASPVLVRDQRMGLICAINSSRHPFTGRQIDFLRVLSAFAGSAIESAQFAEQSRYVLLASERDRIAREMHDGVVQSLFSISLGLEMCKKQVSRDPVAVAQSLDELQERLNTSMTELRRYIYDLRPMKLTELGLVGALEVWVREITQGSPIHGRLVVDGEVPRMTPAEEATLYRGAKEAISNVVRHSQAHKFEVRLRFAEGLASIQVDDDGVGFDSLGVLAGATPGLGLRSIRDMVTREGGAFAVDSSMRGTRLRIDVPVRGAAW